MVARLNLTPSEVDFTYLTCIGAILCSLAQREIDLVILSRMD